MRRMVVVGVVLALGVAMTPAVADEPDVSVRPLPVGTHADYQLGGERALPAGVGIVVRDRTAAPAEGAYNVCYVNGFQTQPDRKRFWRERWRLVLQDGGRPVADEAWGEWLLDIGTPATRQRLARIVGRWLRGCARDGFAAVELDNLDSFTRSRGLLTRRDAVAYARLLVRASHRAGLAVAQKNLAGLDGRRVGFDFAIAESCARYRECGRYAAHYGRRVVMVEYRRRDVRRACRTWGASHPVVLRDRALRPTYRPRFC